MPDGTSDRDKQCTSSKLGEIALALYDASQNNTADTAGAEIQEKKAAEKKEAKKKERSTQVNIKRATVEANSKEELLDKIKNIEWDSIKPEDNKIGSRFDFSI